jgi:hypothetical protein
MTFNATIYDNNSAADPRLQEEERQHELLSVKLSLFQDVLPHDWYGGWVHPSLFYSCRRFPRDHP